MQTLRALERSTVGVRLVARESLSPTVGACVVEVLAAGLCRTDLAVADGRLGRVGVVLGHEASGRVVAIGAGVDARWLGRRVAIWPFVGEAQLGVAIDGVFATRVSVEVEQLHEVPETLDPCGAALFEPVVAALAVEEALADVAPDVPVALLGRNRIATLAQRVLEACGRREVRIVETVDELQGAPVVVETQVDPESLQAALGLVDRGARVVLKSRGWASVTLPLDLVVRRELTLRGALYGDRGRAIELLVGGLDSSGLIGPTFTLDRWEEAFVAARAERSAKVFLLPNAGA